MLHNYCIIAVRNLLRYKGYSFINICGLAVGMACCILILLFVQYELSYDRFHENTDQIYRVIRERHKDGEASSYKTGVSGALAPTLRRNFPEVQQAVRVLQRRLGIRELADKGKGEGRGWIVDEGFLDMFTFPLVKGNPKTVLAEPYSVVITEDIAQVLFGDENPIGKTITAEHRLLKENYTVTGVLKQIPENSTFQFDFLLSTISLSQISDTWNANPGSITDFLTFIMLPQDYDSDTLERKLPDLIETNMSTEARVTYSYHLQPLKQIHLYTQRDYDIQHSKRGDITYVYLISAVGFIVLLLACINFMNLATARSASRAKEVGLRKVIGANRLQLIRQFLGESILLSVIAFVFALILVELLLPMFNSFTGKSLALSTSSSILALTGIALFVGFLSGSYPAFVLSAFQPVEVLKGSLKISPRGNGLRKGLVVIQFSTSIFLIVCAGVIHNQLVYISDTNLGFNKANLIHIPIFRTDRMVEPDPSKRLVNRYSTIKGEFLQNPHVLAATASHDLIGIDGGRQQTVRLGGAPDQELPMWILEVDADFLNTYEIDLFSGRNFSQDIQKDVTSAFLINETAARQLGGHNSLEKQLEIPGLKRTGTVIGIVKDFHGRSLRKKIGPYVICMTPSRYLFITLRIQTDNLPETMAFLETTWKRFISGRPFDFLFLDERLDLLYRDEMRLRRVFAVAAFIAMLIACQGLVGLASFLTSQRTKEIGIRKVLGASVAEIFLLLSASFVKWVIVAMLIAYPMAYHVMRTWLQNFAYRVHLGSEVFLLSGLLVLTLAVTTVGYHTLKAAFASPIDALRNE